jgi:mercuric ion binding protein
MIEVAYNPEKSDLHKIHQAIAKVGHDTKMHKAPDNVYDELPGCCKYERMSTEEDKH